MKEIKLNFLKYYPKGHIQFRLGYIIVLRGKGIPVEDFIPKNEDES